MEQENGKPVSNEHDVEAKRLDLVGDLVRAGGRAHRRLHNVWLHDISRRFYERRLVQARADGVDKLIDRDEPFPVSDASTNINNIGIPPLVGTLAGLGLAGGGAAVALWLAGVIGSGGNAAPVVQPTINPPTVNVDPVDLKIKWWVDGDGAKSEVSELESGEQVNE